MTESRIKVAEHFGITPEAIVVFDAKKPISLPSTFGMNEDWIIVYCPEGNEPQLLTRIPRDDASSEEEALDAFARHLRLVP